MGTQREVSLSFFLRNLIANGTITSEQAVLLATLSTPHQQFAAITAFRSTSGRSLESIVEEIRKGRAAAPVSSPSHFQIPSWAPGIVAAALVGVGLGLVIWNHHRVSVKDLSLAHSPAPELSVRVPVPPAPAEKTALLTPPVHAPARRAKPKLAAKRPRRADRAPVVSLPKPAAPVVYGPAPAAPILPAPDASALAPFPSTTAPAAIFGPSGGGR